MHVYSVYGGGGYGVLGGEGSETDKHLPQRPFTGTYTVKSPNFVTEHDFVTTSKSFCKRPFRFLFKISSLCKNIMPMK